MDGRIQHAIDANQLLVYVRARDPIYNPHLTEYNNLEVVNKLWEEIAEEMEAPVSECKAKWHSLRSSYSRYVRDLKKIPRGSTVKRKKWHLADAMSFLDEFMGPQRSMTSKISMLDNENKYEVDDPNTNPLSQSGDSEDETVPMTDNPMVSVTQERKKRRQSPAAEIVPDEYLQSVTVQNREEDDPNLLFFKSLLPDVEKLKPRNQRRFKSKVMDLLNTFLDSQEDSE